MMVWERNVAANRETRQQVREMVSRVEKQGSGDTGRISEMCGYK